MRSILCGSLAGLWLAGCSGDVEHVFPVTADEARNSRDIYTTITEARGSLADHVLKPNQGDGDGDSRSTIAGQRVGWRVLGRDEDDTAAPAEWNDAVLTVPPSERPPGRRLWEAALTSVSSIALQQTDPARGLIVSDWLISPDRPEERVRTTIYVLGEEPVPGNVRVVFEHQRRDENGEWVYAPASALGMAKLEQRILEDARRLR